MLTDDAWPGPPFTTPAIERQLYEFFIDGVVTNAIARTLLSEEPVNPSGSSTVCRTGTTLKYSVCLEKS